MTVTHQPGASRLDIVTGSDGVPAWYAPEAPRLAAYVEAAYERRSVAVTSIIKSSSGFGMIVSETGATTTGGRLAHHAHQILTN